MEKKTELLFFPGHLYIEKNIDAFMERLCEKLGYGHYTLIRARGDKPTHDIESAIEQCKTAITLEPDNINAHIYTGYFYSIAEDYEKEEE